MRRIIKIHIECEAVINSDELEQLIHNALRAALREDPDVILIGEIRDQETLATALEASQTGHLVFGTLHTNSAVKTVERVLGMYPPNEQDSVRRSVSESLIGVIAQGLIKLPIWIPQLSFIVGVVVFFIAVLDELFAVIRREKPAYQIADEERRARGDFSETV